MSTARELACALCGGGRQPYSLDARGRLVCRKGCHAASQRSAPVRASVIPGPAPRAVATAERCACGGSGEWLELRGKRLVACCPACSDLVRVP